MSLRIMTIVWETSLPAAQKMVLLALADNSDDEGRNCFPSTGTITRKCSMSHRSVFRHLASLEANELISRKERPGHSTNYILHVEKIRAQTKLQSLERAKFAKKSVPATIHEPEGKSPCAPGTGVPGNLRRYEASDSLTGVPDWHVPQPNWHSPTDNLSPITTKEPSINHHNNTTDEHGCRGVSNSESNLAESELIWPVCSIEERMAVSRLISELHPEQKQTLLDEIEGARRAGSIRKGIVPYAGGLVRAVKSGTFSVGYSPGVAAQRRLISSRDIQKKSIQLATEQTELDSAALRKGVELMDRISKKNSQEK